MGCLILGVALVVSGVVSYGLGWLVSYVMGWGDGMAFWVGLVVVGPCFISVLCGLASGGRRWWMR